MRNNMYLRKVLVFIFLLSAGVSQADKSIYQSSTSLNATLGIRDMEKLTGSFDATFYITDPEGKVFEKQITVQENQFGYVVFPTDFHTWLKIGKYSWVATVNGKQVISGAFEQVNSFTLRNIPQQ